MTAFKIENPFTFFSDLQGDPLHQGKIYIGVENLNPVLEVNQIPLYSDEDFTVPLAQPVRTIDGVPVSGNTPIQIFTNGVQRVAMTVHTAGDIFVWNNPSLASPTSGVTSGGDYTLPSQLFGTPAIIGTGEDRYNVLFDGPATDGLHRHFGILLVGEDGKQHYIYRRASQHARKEDSRIIYTSSNNGGANASAEMTIIQPPGGVNDGQDRRDVIAGITPDGIILAGCNILPVAGNVYPATVPIYASYDNGVSFQFLANLTTLEVPGRFIGRIKSVVRRDGGYRLSVISYEATDTTGVTWSLKEYIADSTDLTTWTARTIVTATGAGDEAGANVFNEAEIAYYTPDYAVVVARSGANDRSGGIKLYYTTNAADTAPTWTYAGIIPGSRYVASTGADVKPTIDLVYYNGNPYFIILACERVIDTTRIFICAPEDILRDGTASIEFLTNNAYDITLAGGYAVPHFYLNGECVYLDYAENFGTPSDTDSALSSRVRINRVNLTPFIADYEKQEEFQPALYGEFTENSVLTPVFNFARASATTRVNPSGIVDVVDSGQIAIDHCPARGCVRGVSIGSQKTIKNTYSEQFDNAAYVKTRATVTANATVAPDGASTADKLVEDSTAAQSHYISQVITSSDASLEYVISIFAKAAERDYLYINIEGGTAGAITYSGGCYFDLNRGLRLGLDDNPGSAGNIKWGKIEKYPDGWYRLMAKVRPDNVTGATQIIANIHLAEFATVSGVNALRLEYDGDGTSGVYIWGLNVIQDTEEGAYRQTTTAAVTTQADVLIIPNLSQHNADPDAEGTILVVGEATAAYRGLAGTDAANVVDFYPNEQGFISVNDGTADEEHRISCFPQAYDIINATRTGGANTFSASAAHSMDEFTAAYSFKSGLQLGAVNGELRPAGTATSLPSGLNQIILGGRGGSNISGRMWIRKFAYFPKALTAGQIRRLTKNGFSFPNNVVQSAPKGQGSTTPTFSGTGSEPAYTTQTLYYSRVGNLVTVEFAVQANGAITLTGALSVDTKLPWNAKYSLAVGYCTVTNANLGSDAGVFIVPEAGTTLLNINHRISNADSVLNATEVSNDFKIQGSITFTVTP